MTDRDVSSRVQMESSPPASAALSTATLWAAGSLGVLSAVTAALTPLLVAVWSEQFGFPIEQAGYIASAELAMQAVGTVSFIGVSRFLSWRACSLLGVSLLLAGNVLTAANSVVGTVMLAQAVAGLGGGLVRALCMSCLARAGKPSRAFSLYAVGQMLIGAAGTAMMPRLIEFGGGKGVFLILAGVSSLGYIALRWLPRARFAVMHPRTRARVFPRAAVVALVALFLYFLGQGALWTFLPKIGSNQNLSSATVGAALAYSNLAGLAGAMLVGLVGYRLNNAFALGVLLPIGLLSLAGIYLGHTSLLYSASVCVFYFAWCASFPFQFAIIARVDPTASASTLVPAIDAFGLACGPALAATLFRWFGAAAPGWIYACAGISSIAMFVKSSVSTSPQAPRASTPATSAATPRLETP